MGICDMDKVTLEGDYIHMWGISTYQDKFKVTGTTAMLKKRDVATIKFYADIGLLTITGPNGLNVTANDIPMKIIAKEKIYPILNLGCSGNSASIRVIQ